MSGESTDVNDGGDGGGGGKLSDSVLDSLSPQLLIYTAHNPTLHQPLWLLHYVQRNDRLLATMSPWLPICRHITDCFIAHGAEKQKNMPPGADILCIWLELCNQNHNCDLWPFELKIGIPVTPALGNVNTNFGLTLPFCLCVNSLYGTDRQWTEKQMDGQVPWCGPIGQPHNDTDAWFLRATAVPAGTAEARISYGNSVCPSVCLSVCLSVTTRWYTKPIWDRDSWSSPYDSPESLVSYEVIWCRWVRGFPSNKGIKEGYPP